MTVTAHYDEQSGETWLVSFARAIQLPAGDCADRNLEAIAIPNGKNHCHRLKAT
jgi:hypothetical protein